MAYETHSIIDTTLGIKAEATALLHLLGNVTPSDWDAELDESGLFYVKDKAEVRTRTSPWYCGRQKGYVLQYGFLAPGLPTLFIAFFPHKSTDSITVEHWEGKSGNNPICTFEERHRAIGGEASDAAYLEQRSFGEDLAAARDYIVELLKEFHHREH